MDTEVVADIDVLYDDDVGYRHPPPIMGGLLAPNVGVGITLNTIRDAIVSKSTIRSYIPEILLFCFWCRMYAVNCLTEHCIAMLDDFLFEFHGRDV